MKGFGHIFGLAIGVTFTLGLIATMLVFGTPLGPVLSVELILAIYGFALFAYFSYREARQEELRTVLTIAIDARSPLAEAVWAYAEDRPRSFGRRFFEGIIANILVLGSYWTWHKRRRFDRRIIDLATHLEAGMPLSAALEACPGTASSETMLAASVGESTGKLSQALASASQTRLAPIVLEAMPRLVYPLLIAFMMVALVSFQALFIVPKFEKITSDFRIALPETVKVGYASARVIASYVAPATIFVALTLLWMTPALIVSPGFRWRLPLIGRLERRMCQGRILKMLGLLLAAGKTAPEALRLLASRNYLGLDPQRQIELALAGVEAGQPLADELAARRLIPETIPPFLHSAEKAHNLPWAFAEAGETVIRQVRTRFQRLTAVFGPVAIAVLGLCAGFAALCVFLPLIAILTELTPP
jgi:general secretion pathway protein F